MGRMVLWGLLLLGAPTLLLAVLDYLAFRYRVTPEELILDSGVLSRRHRVVPLSRVQNLEVRQTALQRAFGVAELRVETAGGSTEEAVPLVLGRSEAERLRAELLARRAGIRAVEGASGQAGASEGGVLAHLSARDLVLAGATANEAGVIAAVLVGALEAAYQLPLGLPRFRPDPTHLIPDLPLLSSILLGAAALLVLFSLAWLLSIIGALVGYWDFRLERTEDELRKAYGGVDRHEVTVPLQRVQALRVEESLLRRPLGLASLKIETAGGRPGEAQRGGAEAFLPLARIGNVPRLVAALFGDLGYGDLSFRPVHSYARRRAFVRYSTLVLLLTGGAAAWLGTSALWLLTLLLPAYLAAEAHYRHLAYALAPGYVVGRSGFWNRVTWIVPERKVHTMHLVETPFQRRNGVATVVVDTAAGPVPIVHLGRGDALSLLTGVAARAGRSEVPSAAHARSRQ